MEKETWALVGAAAAIAGPLIFNTVKEAVWERKKRKREERHIVIQLIFVLDKYISQCEFLSYNDGIYDPDKEYKVTRYVKPELQLSSVKGDYKSLDADMLYRLHSIDSKREQVISELSNLDDSYFDDAPDCTGYYAKRQELYAKHGLYVIELSENICRKFKIKHVSWGGGFNPAVSIRERLVQIRASKSRATLRRMEMKAKRVAEKHRELL
ncbi:hypothetical protein OGM23_04190 [Dickeya fangzhongdai]|uniref:hypothetical protein n=1 Tax=Pectobacteriaceae TaxID=1903410 RepID=UPI0025A2787C|nr:hypothetical protein [Pectobacterium brasiliense]WJM79975.1 hypothetical protein QTI90_16985 [Pectobacterium brasiliense]WPD76570.1 hypothetical protein OGM23_04190 [Dickeya fangzhongdai]